MNLLDHKQAGEVETVTRDG